MNTAAQPVIDADVVEAKAKPESRAVAPRGRTAPDSSPAGMIVYAMNNGASVAEIRELYALKKEWEADEAKKSYNLAMSEFKQEPNLVILKRKFVGYETKDQSGNVNGSVGYSHAELSDVTDVVVPALARHGLSHRWNVRQENGLVHIDCILTHAQGHSELVTMFANPDNSGKKNGIQQIASTVSYLERYTLLAACGLSTKGMDDDARSAGDDEAPPAEPEDPAVAKLKADLYAVADEGLARLQAAWAELGQANRKLVGSVAFGKIKAKAEAVGP